jgi:hypothetical protein
MRRRGWWGALALVVILGLLAGGCGLTQGLGDYFSAQDTGLRKRLVVVPFTSGLAKLAPRARAWDQGSRRELAQEGGLVLVDYSRLAAAMQRVPARIKDREQRMVWAGRSLGLNAILRGQITDLSVRRRLTGIWGFRDNTPFLGLEVDLSLLDTASGTVIARQSHRAEVEISDVLAEGIRMGNPPPAKLVDKLVDKQVKHTRRWVVRAVASQRWAGFVLKVEGKRVLTTVGRDTGLPLGAMLTVYGWGERIRTGAGTTIHLPGGPVATLRLDKLGPRTAWATVVGGAAKPSRLLPGMLIRAR